MGDDAPAERRWSRERWFLTIAIIFAVQVVVIIWLSGPMESVAQPEQDRLITHYYTAAMSAELEPLVHLIDPTLYSQADREGFSGAVWLDVKPVEHRSEGWADPPQFLKFNRDQLLAELDEFGRADPPQRRPIPARLVGDPQNRIPLSSQLKPASTTTLELTGDLGMDDLESVPTPPSVEFNGVLPPTVLVLQVDRRGRVFSSNLLRSSGQDSADRLAMKFAEGLQFTIADGFAPTTDARDFASMRRATFTIHWATVPVPVKKETNAPPAAPVKEPEIGIN